LTKGRKWQKSVTERFPTDKQWEALNILGLLILNRFRDITYEEVIAMLNFDLMDSVAGRQLFEMGQQDVREKWLENAKETVLKVLDARFGVIPDDITDKIRAINYLEVLNNLHEEALRCFDLQNFEKRLL
jgi:sigma54-dependent transcription regulator